MTFNSDSSILVTGGTGSFGKAFIAEVLTRFLCTPIGCLQS